ncbi:hypothetical protein KIL84_002436 [Mauremys mutica]|uniref:Uncharacterized protein n=1 Tax=Mauremys mutica TaxID=74926 RepID=A0A9D3X6A0_9SAUR|nr:hypothetical protein KIL84_002436 [Mauremys mutica]
MQPRRVNSWHFVQKILLFIMLPLGLGCVMLSLGLGHQVQGRLVTIPDLCETPHSSPPNGVEGSGRSRSVGCGHCVPCRIGVAERRALGCWAVSCAPEVSKIRYSRDSEGWLC